jgi:hypothetical protein
MNKQQMKQVPFLIEYLSEPSASAIQEVGEKYGLTITAQANAIREVLQKIRSLSLRRAAHYQFAPSAMSMLQTVSET